MEKQIECTWKNNMTFEALIDGHTIILDADEENGGNNKGPRPKTLLLAALAGCTGMDVVAILKKMKVEFNSLIINVKGIMTEEHPKYFKSMHILYRFKGANLDLSKINKAIELSQERYCGVTAQFKMGIPITHEVIIE